MHLRNANILKNSLHIKIGFLLTLGSLGDPQRSDYCQREVMTVQDSGWPALALAILVSGSD